MYTKHKSGFTVLEILAILAIIGILAAIAVPRFLLSTSIREEEACDANKGTIAVQVERYYLANSSYPNFATLSTDANYFPHGAPECPGGGVYAINATGAVICTTMEGGS